MLKRKIIPYNPKLKQRTRELRKNSTLSEVLLWMEIKGKKIRGYQFHRQVPIDEYIVDFYCHELMLAIEIDGASHDNFEKDLKRQKRIEGLGVSFLRFYDSDVKNNLHSVVQLINDWIIEFENNKKRK